MLQDVPASATGSSGVDGMHDAMAILEEQRGMLDEVSGSMAEDVEDSLEAEADRLIAQNMTHPAPARLEMPEVPLLPSVPSLPPLVPRAPTTRLRVAL